MYGSGSKQLIEAMQYILNEEEASKDLLQFSNKDKITIIPFNHEILGYFTGTIYFVVSIPQFGLNTVLSAFSFIPPNQTLLPVFTNSACPSLLNM